MVGPPGLSVSLIIPTRNRPAELGRTLERCGRLESGALGPAAEAFVVDNASKPPASVPTRLANGVPVRPLRLGHNAAAAARNAAAAAAGGDWLVMLDDDSAPLPSTRFVEVLQGLPSDVAAVGGDIALAGGGREAGGGPEIVVGCGCAFRRDVFLAVGGYDPSFEFYAEEADLCVRLLAAGYRVVHDQRLRFLHEKTVTGRDFGGILRRLVRNNRWLLRRYAPEALEADLAAAMLTRYHGIAEREQVTDAWHAGVAEAEAGLSGQPDRRVAPAVWNRFTGEAAVRTTLAEALTPGEPARLVAAGKGADVVAAVLNALGCPVRPGADRAVVATTAPGPMLDAAEAHPRAVLPWHFP